MLRMMPIMERSVTVAYFPWEMFDATDEAWAVLNHDQTLTRLAQRGGLGICELVAIIEHRAWRKMDLGEAWAALWAVAQIRTMNNVR